MTRIFKLGRFLWKAIAAPARRLACVLCLACASTQAHAALIPLTADILAEQRSKWELSSISSYIYEGQAICFCIPHLVEPHRVTVLDGVVTERLFAATLLPDNDPGAAFFYRSVEGLFDYLEQGINEGWEILDAMFDAETGRPLEFFADPVPFIADDEYRFVMSSFSPVVPAPGSAALLLLSLALLHCAGRRRAKR